MPDENFHVTIFHLREKLKILRSDLNWFDVKKPLQCWARSKHNYERKDFIYTY